MNIEKVFENTRKALAELVEAKAALQIERAV